MDKRFLIFVVGLTIALFFVNQWFSPAKSPQKPAAPPQQVVSTLKEEFSPSSDTLSTPAVAPSAHEEFFVLENGYQQIVFSNIGGAIAEINLPFQSKENPESAVLPIHIDRTF